MPKGFKYLIKGQEIIAHGERCEFRCHLSNNLIEATVLSGKDKGLTAVLAEYDVDWAMTQELAEEEKRRDMLHEEERNP